jgi:hypothetical protein
MMGAGDSSVAWGAMVVVHAGCVSAPLRPHRACVWQSLATTQPPSPMEAMRVV